MATLVPQADQFGELIDVWILNSALPSARKMKQYLEWNALSMQPVAFVFVGAQMKLIGVMPPGGDEETKKDSFADTIRKATRELEAWGYALVLDARMWNLTKPVLAEHGFDDSVEALSSIDIAKLREAIPPTDALYVQVESLLGDWAARQVYATDGATVAWDDVEILPAGRAVSGRFSNLLSAPESLGNA